MLPSPDEALPSIDENARRQFERAWKSGTPRPIEEFLPAATDPHFLATLAELVQIELEQVWKEWSQVQSVAASTRLTSGTVLGPPHVEQYLARFPVLRDAAIVERLVAQEIELRAASGEQLDQREFAERFPTLKLDWNALSPSRDGDGQSHTDFIVRLPDQISPSQPHAFGDYVLLERLGDGGMGVVYRARQAGTHREVAIKIIRVDRPASERSSWSERFRVEARATARIDHPQVVTIHEVGEHHGMAFYSMRYVAGRNLAAITGQQPMEQRRAAGLIASVARALQAVHDRAVLHRDLKPHNIILDDQSQLPIIADFGLAKLLEEDTVITRTGDVLGTPAYMAPEQARDACLATTRSDVYALGATLYYLLTGQPPFRAATLLLTLKQVTDTEPLPPRRHTPALHSDLEVICLKCMHKEPDRRYASAQALAEDLERWLGQRPITARPVSRGERAVLWCRRHPGLAVMAAATSASIVVGIGALGLGYSYKTAALEESQKSRERAHGAVNEFFTLISEDVLLDQPGMQPLRRDLLERALKHYRAYLQESADDPGLQAEVAATHYRIGRISDVIESADRARAAYDRAIVLQRELSEKQPDVVEHQAALGASLNALAAVAQRQGQPQQALALFREAAKLRQRVVQQRASDVESQRLLANSIMNEGLVWKSQDDTQQARRLITASIDQRKSLLVAPGNTGRELRRDQAMAYYNLANLEIELDRLEDAVAPLQSALEMFGQLTVDWPEDLRLRQQQAVAARLLGDLWRGLGTITDAERNWASAESIIRQLALENPRVPQFALELGRLLLSQGELKFEQQAFEAARTRVQEAQEILERLDRSGEFGDEIRGERAKAHQVLAAVLEQQGESAAAMASLRQAQSLLHQTASGTNANAETRLQLEATESHLERLSSPGGAPP